MLVYAILTLIDAGIVLIYPETKGKEMPDTIHETEMKKPDKIKKLVTR
jgi:hypothetical protein